MPEHLVKIRGIDPLLFRDGRPFGLLEGAQSARTLPFPMPGTIAGFLRTRIGEALGWDWKNGGASLAKGVAVHGPVPVMNSQAMFEAPADCVITKTQGSNAVLLPLRPLHLPQGAGCNTPADLLPLDVVSRSGSDETAKPDPGYRFWRWPELEKWLLDARGTATQPPAKVVGPPVEERIHVRMQPESGTSSEAGLFTVQFLAFEHYRRPGEGEGATAQPQGLIAEEWGLLAKVAAPEGVDLSGPGLLGGERRLAAVEEAPHGLWPACPSSVKDALGAARRVRMMLATPAVFKGGWKPGWLNEELFGTPPGSSLTLKLVSAAVPRRKAVSGWDYEHGRPKAVRWLVPAGSVYFFEVVDGGAGQLGSDGWLAPVSDDGQDRRDGYGLALWGIWDN
ncbi:MAG: type III-B CRISPR module-associated Cmr3 family protein [Chthonomonadales bacterium]